MSQHDFVIANQGASAARTDINNGLQALASLNSGTTAPSTTYANMLWYETDTDTLWIRNEANSGWLRLLDIDQSLGAQLIENNVVNTSGTIIGYLGTHSQATWDTGTNTSERLISPDKLEAAIQTHAPNTGWVEIDRQEPTSNVNNVTFTGLGSYKTIRITWAASLSTGALGNGVDIQVRPTAGTWRTIGRADMDDNTGRSHHGITTISNNGGSEKLIICNGTSTIGAQIMDRSNATQSRESGIIHGGYSTHDTTIDEARLDPSTGQWEGTTADRRGVFICEGLAA